MKHFDIIIIGGGASGMTAAIRAKKLNQNKSFAILEKQDRLGRKLMSTGNGRCNLTNAEANGTHYHGSFSKFADKLFEKYSPEYVIDFFSDLGLMCRIESEGRVYPLSNHASAVLDVLRFGLEKLKVSVFCGCEVKEIKHKNSFRIISDDEVYTCDSLIIATGSCASPKLGASAEGISMLSALGHKTNKLSPALCPVKVNDSILKQLKGLRVNGKAEILDDNNSIKEECGEIQFTEKALSGICVFNLSSYVNKLDTPNIRLSFLPDMSFTDIMTLLEKQREIMKERPLDDLFTGIFQRKLGSAIIKRAGIGMNKSEVGALKPNELKKIASVINDFRFKAEKNYDFNNAQVVSGGVLAEDINQCTMESKKIKNLFICGEAVDIDGDCGGFNLQFAFASGLCAGDNV